MNNRLALVGLTIAAVMAAVPAVTSAQEAGTNPWRVTPQSGGAYAPMENKAAQAMQVPQFSQPKYAPLDGRLPDDKKAVRAPFGGAFPAQRPIAPAVPGNGLYGPGVGGLGYGVPVYDGFGYPGLGYPGAGYGGYPGLGYSGLGYPGSWGGLGPLSGWNTGYGGPLSWMPFW